MTSIDIRVPIQQGIRFPRRLRGGRLRRPWRRRHPVRNILFKLSSATAATGHLVGPIAQLVGLIVEHPVPAVIRFVRGAHHAIYVSGAVLGGFEVAGGGIGADFVGGFFCLPRWGCWWWGCIRRRDCHGQYCGHALLPGIIIWSGHGSRLSAFTNYFDFGAVPELFGHTTPIRWNLPTIRQPRVQSYIAPPSFRKWIICIALMLA
mmetsp:Transcript_43343/g.77903  ORF Transcript_43343/g.77903 Transcript_43343/m.77903 type:complete len:205 (+) Transcript_43343:1982-2596(+)